MTLQEIEQRLVRGKLGPHEMADLRATLSGMYSHNSGILEKILEIKATAWVAMRGNHKSDKATDRAWEATPEGLQEMKLRMSLKKMEKMMSSLKSLLDVATGQARNQF